MVLRLIAELQVKCNDCGFESSCEDHSTHIQLCEAAPVVVTHPTAGPSTATEPDFPAQNTMTLEKAMEELRQGNILPEMKKVGTLFVKSNKLLSGWQNSPA